MSENHFPDTVPEEFWAIIEEAQQDPARFRKILRSLNRGRLIRFYWTYEELANRLRTERYWPRVDPNLSEDGLAELANWVVAQGKEYYRKILEHPESIPPKKNDPGLLSELVEEYEERYSNDVPPNTHLWDDEWKARGKKSPWA
jgi:hypothetical protein